MTTAASFHALHSCLFLERNAKRSENKVKPKTVQVIATVLQHFSPSSSILKSTTPIGAIMNEIDAVVNLLTWFHNCCLILWPYQKDKSFQSLSKGTKIIRKWNVLPNITWCKHSLQNYSGRIPFRGRCPNIDRLLASLPQTHCTLVVLGSNVNNLGNKRDNVSCLVIIGSFHS